MSVATSLSVGALSALQNLLTVISEHCSLCRFNQQHKDQNMSWRRIACAVAVSIAGTPSGISYADDSNKAVGRSVIQQGFEASPIPKNKLNFAGKDPYLVGLGAYLVNAAADCSGCHSFPRFLPLGDPAGSNPAFNDPYSRTPSHQGLS